MYKAAVVLTDEPQADDVLRLRPGVNLRAGLRSFEERLGKPTSLEEDLLVLGSSIFACDLAFKRGEREAITRQIELTVPVVNLAAFNGIARKLCYALYVLSHDAWNVRFAQREGVPEETRDWREETGKVLLFSGGLDSLAAAVHYGDAGEHIHLVSHVTANRAVSGAQESLFAHLDARYLNQFERTAFRVGGINRSPHGFPFPADQQREDTQRTRSFLFLALAALVARRRGIRDIVLIAENGQMAIHLPLTAARISAFSTHTAHPEFVYEMGLLASDLLGYPIQIENPFLYKTKAEVVKEVVQNHPETLEHAVSCWKASRVSGYNHCGLCIPCLVRRIAIETHGVKVPEYQRDLLLEDVGALGPGDDGKRNLVELGEFVRFFEATAHQATIEDAYPELVNRRIDAEQAVDMYRRFAAEARTVFDRYDSVRSLLS